MRQRIRRLPSPALVISIVALAAALGGGAFAIASSDSHVKKIATEVVKKLEPKLSVKHAKSADTATHAGSADTATHAGSADIATHAGSADTATHADSATHATSADTATNATSADSATHATSADSATNAATASNATNLGGQPASAFLPASSVSRIDATPSGCPLAPAAACQPVLFQGQGFTLQARCRGGADGQSEVDANSIPGTLSYFAVATSNVTGNGPVTSRDFATSGNVTIGAIVQPTAGGGGGAPSGPAAWDGTIVLRTATHTVTIDLHEDVASDGSSFGTCHYYGNAVEG